jgi:hypothetical protein
MDAKGVTVKGLIHAATARTRTALEQCQLQPELMKHQWAENRLADFTLWDSGIGASARDKVSLDHRLASQPETQDVVLSLLRTLAAEADRCTEQGRAALKNSNTLLRIPLICFRRQSNSAKTAM